MVNFNRDIRKKDLMAYNSGLNLKESKGIRYRSLC